MNGYIYFYLVEFNGVLVYLLSPLYISLFIFWFWQNQSSIYIKEQFAQKGKFSLYLLFPQNNSGTSQQNSTEAFSWTTEADWNMF